MLPGLIANQTVAFKELKAGCERSKLRWFVEGWCRAGFEGLVVCLEVRIVW